VTRKRAIATFRSSRPIGSETSELTQVAQAVSKYVVWKRTRALGVHLTGSFRFGRHIGSGSIESEPIITLDLLEEKWSGCSACHREYSRIKTMVKATRMETSGGERTGKKNFQNALAVNAHCRVGGREVQSREISRWIKGGILLKGHDSLYHNGKA